jgi:hypothetical protein
MKRRTFLAGSVTAAVESPLLDLGAAPRRPPSTKLISQIGRLAQLETRKSGKDGPGRPDHFGKAR